MIDLNRKNKLKKGLLMVFGLTVFGFLGLDKFVKNPSSKKIYSDNGKLMVTIENG